MKVEQKRLGDVLLFFCSAHPQRAAISIGLPPAAEHHNAAVIQPLKTCVVVVVVVVVEPWF